MRFIKKMGYLLPLAYSPFFSNITVEATNCGIGSYEKYTLSNGQAVFTCTSLGAAFQSAKTQVLGQNSIISYIDDFIRNFAGVSFGIAFLIIIYAGFEYVLSQSDLNKVESAKKHLNMAFIGVGISMLSFVIQGIILKAVGS